MDNFYDNDFLNLLSKYDIKTLYHFTDRSNLSSIIERGGLYSWYDCVIKKIHFTSSSSAFSKFLDNKSNLERFVHVSFVKEHPMMYSALNEGRIKDPIILRIDPIVICQKKTLYTICNSVRNGTEIGQGFDFFNKIHFSSLKAYSVHDLCEEEQLFYQAEVLVKNYIPLSLISFSEKELPFIKDMAINGSRNAQYIIGKSYELGQGVNIDLDEAFNWYLRSADLGHPIAQCNVGSAYLNGKGTQINYDKAFEWFERSFNQKNGRAAVALSFCYENGYGVAKDINKAKTIIETKCDEIEFESGMGTYYTNQIL